jgi:dephospho-CoA kinase
VLTAIVERFGQGVLLPDGELDRPALAAMVFSDAEALKELNAIVHPAVGAEIARRIEAASETDAVVVLDIPLLAENPRKGLAATVVVDTPVDVAVERLVRLRGMDEEDARARIARQATREERAAGADRIIDNAGDLAALEAQVDDLWAWLTALPST